MASWNIPALIDKIANDIPAIKDLLTALFKWTSSGTTNAPIGAKRLQSVTGGVQLQEHAGSDAWNSVGKLMHDVDSLDGKHAAAGLTADTIPVRDSSGAVSGDITGNAATASVASSIASGYIVPIANGGTNANSASGARASLGANDAGNINAGTLATSYGGTGRTDGKATDVYVSGYSAGAVSLGQLGHASQKSGVNANTLASSGLYYCTGCTSVLNYPLTEDCFVRVEASGAVVKTVNSAEQTFIYIVQTVTGATSGKTYTRKSIDGGTNWSAWTSSGSLESGDVHIYVSKQGSDANSGSVSSSPVLTIGRMLMIAAGAKTTGRLICHFGAGEWGRFAIDGNLVQTHSIRISNYTDTQVGTTPIVAEGATVPEGTYFEDLTGDSEPPHFNGLSVSNALVTFGNVSADVFSFDNTDAAFDGAVSFCAMTAYRSSIALASHIIRRDNDITAPVFALDDSHLGISCGAGLCKLINEPLNAKFLTCKNKCSIELNSQVNWDGLFAGQKFSFESPVIVYGDAAPEVLPGSAGDGSWFDKNNVHLQNGTSALANVDIKAETGVVTASIKVLNADSPLVNGAASPAVLSVVHNADGSKYATAPTPPNGDKSTKIATTEWTATNSFPAGTKMLFQQSAAPTGWVKVTEAAYNNTALRLVTGNIANRTDKTAFTTWMDAGRTTSSTTQGGTIGNTTATGTVGNKALSVAMLAKHAHTYASGNDNDGGADTLYSGRTIGTQGSKNAGSGSNHNHGFTGTAHGHSFTGSAHSHTLDLGINYIDCIMATKS
jgi:hypothetical protein